MGVGRSIGLHLPRDLLRSPLSIVSGVGFTRVQAFGASCPGVIGELVSYLQSTQLQLVQIVELRHDSSLL